MSNVINFPEGGRKNAPPKKKIQRDDNFWLENFISKDDMSMLSQIDWDNLTITDTTNYSITLADDDTLTWVGKTVTNKSTEQLHEEIMTVASELLYKIHLLADVKHKQKLGRILVELELILDSLKNQ